MNDNYYEFWLKLNTFLNRQGILADRLLNQEKQLGINILAIKSVVAPEVFNRIIEPLINLLEDRQRTLIEMSESSDEFSKQMSEFGGDVKNSLKDNKNDKSN